MKIRAEVRSTDLGLNQLRNLIDALNNRGTYVKVGVLEDAGQGGDTRDGGLTNAEIAAIHEFGSSDGRIPERSFIRSTFFANKSQYLEMYARLLTKVVNGQIGIDDVFDTLGMKISTDMKKRVTTGDQIPPPNAPSTIWKKTWRERQAVKVSLAKLQRNTSVQRDFEAASTAGPLRRRDALKFTRAFARAGRAQPGALNSVARAVARLADAPDQVRTLIDTGRMIASLTWAVVNRNRTQGL